MKEACKREREYQKKLGRVRKTGREEKQQAVRPLFLEREIILLLKRRSNPLYLSRYLLQ